MSDSAKKISLVDSTYRVKWEVTKEQFDNCDFPNKIYSPTYAIDIDGEKSQWYLSLYPKGYKEGILLKKVHIGLNRRERDNKIYQVKYQFGIETEDGHWPEDAFKKFYSRNSLTSVRFFGNKSGQGSQRVSPGWGYSMCTNEEFKRHFVDNKVTVVAFFVIYAEGQKHLNDMKVADNLLAKVRSMSSFESLSDFTIISGESRFPCHRVFLAATSKYFETLFRNEPSKKETTMEDPPEIVGAMLDYMYKGKIPNDIDEKAMDLILMSDMYGLDLLTMACETSMVNNLSKDNAVETLITIDKIKHVSKLEHRKEVLAFIKKEADVIAQTKDWDKFVQSYPKLITEILLFK